jgi:hypothetical protein
MDGTIIHTSDGIYWLLQTTNTTKTINDIFFINSLEGWAAGSEVLLHTIDGGTTWTRELESLLTGKGLLGVYFTYPNNGYVVGNAVVLKYGEITGISDKNETTKFEIFPNPAKNKFGVQSLKFKGEDAIIEIYDLNSRKLIEQHIPAGTENAEIDISHLKNGVYFCRLVSEKYSATKKLIIQQ